ncbi:Heterokaryon incompatibility protein (HET) domain containing protein [Hyaloscypha variabilis]
MWLIDTKTLKLKYVTNPEDERYAILSHTWGSDEVTFEDMKNPAVAQGKLGYQKILKTCERAEARGLFYAWVDTCCIDKSSSAELSESINSMFRWYSLSTLCFAWLEDWKPQAGSGLESMGRSRWFTRGWTLQELIAPKRVEFLDHDWTFRGDRATLAGTICEVTRIDSGVINGSRSLSEISVGRRMSWAASRETTRVEDRAYSLMGLFEINMPLLYGEGQKAFLRLQEEIANSCSALSLFAWEAPSRYLGQQQFFGIFAPEPDYFEGCNTLVAQNNQFHNLNNFVITNKGLNMDTSLVECRISEHQKVRGLPLWCHREEDWTKSLVLPLTRTALGYVRSHYGVLGWTNPPFQPFSMALNFHGDLMWDTLHSEPKQFLLRKALSPAAADSVEADDSRFLSIKLPKSGSVAQKIHARGFPPALWDEERIGFHLAGCKEFIGFVIIQITIANFDSVGEVQVVCGYCQEIGGPWACFVSPIVGKGKRMREMGFSGLRCARLLSQFREFNDEARQNSWRGYQIIRQHILMNSSLTSPFRTKKTKMRVDEPFNWCDTKAEAIDPAKLQIRAHIECSDCIYVTETRGEITVTIIDPNRPLNGGLSKMFS